MRRVTISLEHEWLYQEPEAEAAIAGRPVDDIVEEALHAWLDRRSSISFEHRVVRSKALALSDRLWLRQPQDIDETSLEVLDRIRDERS